MRPHVLRIVEFLPVKYRYKKPFIRRFTHLFPRHGFKTCWLAKPMRKGEGGIFTEYGHLELEK